ncbi:MAG: hypothetical protein QME90_14085, partial [Thermodesulfobacteriota bacterium]|nr:hypothetical protein [Thermodesulfobacteriota bacterium]
SRGRSSKVVQVILQRLLSGKYLFIIIALAFLLPLLGEARAAPYFQGKVITFVVADSAGGGTDVFARLASRHLPKYIPGKPVCVIRNIAGGGQLIGANYVWAAKPNGLTCLITGGGNILNSQLRPKGTVYKLDEMLPIYAGSIGRVYFVRRGMIKEPKEIVNAKGLVFGHESPTSGIGGNFVWAKELLGIPIERFVWGYGGSAASRLAFLAGEINMIGETTFGYNAAIKPYIERGEIIPVFQSGETGGSGNIVRSSPKAAPDVPSVPELYQQIYGKPPSGIVFEAYKTQVATCTYARAIVFPPKVPADIIDVLRKAAIQMVNDANFQSEIEVANPGGTHYVGDALVRNYSAAVGASPDLAQFLKKTLIEKYDMRFD